MSIILSIMTITKSILSDLRLIVGEKISMLLIIYIWENFCAMSLTLYLSIEPSGLYIILNTNFQPITFVLLWR